MKISRLLLFLGFIMLASGLYSQSQTINESQMLIRRVLPSRASHFVVEEIKADSARDVFEIEAAPGGKIVLRGNNGVSVATAFNWYLKKYVLASYSWQADKPLKINGQLPLPAKKVRQVCRARERFMNNTCTFGYTFAFWSWEKWQRYLDWMAMNGINRPLLLAGQEAVWLKVWQTFGLNADNVLSFFSGPAHLPWHRMANMDKWGGPLPMSYVVEQQDLQQQILLRARALGMKPILPAFAGHVPEQLQVQYPSAKINRITPGWGGMDEKYTTYFLDPTDPLFMEIQKRYLTEQNNMYGTDHLYSADPFNEIAPPSWEPGFLANVGETIYRSMASVDKEAKWYQMSWTFYFDTDHWTKPRLSAMFNSVPKGKLVFLDYACEEAEFYKKTSGFEGDPFIWNYLGNFGGNTFLVGPVNKVSASIVGALEVPNCLGVGSTLEGINANQYIYEMVFEIPWYEPGTFRVNNWVANYAYSRAERKDMYVAAAWRLLKDSVLVDSAVAIWNHSSIFQAVPVTDLSKVSWTSSPKIPYNNKTLARSVGYLLEAKPETRTSDAYRYDVVNLTRQMLSNYGLVIYHKMIRNYEDKNVMLFRKYSRDFIQLGLEIDELLGTRHEFLLGQWLDDARKQGNARENDYYVRNARQIITTWHKAGGELTDYSNRQWNGLMKTYYLPRWEEFIKETDDAMLKGEKLEYGHFTSWCEKFEDNWVNDTKSKYLTDPSGDELLIANRLYKKYKREIMRN